jgi:ribonuclease BN (tRNA processing enzyme)
VCDLPAYWPDDQDGASSGDRCGHDHDGHSCADVPGAVSRRVLLGAAAAASAGSILASPMLAAAMGRVAPSRPKVATGRRRRKGTYVVLLGTNAGPIPMSGRQGIASAVVVDGHAYLVDCGMGIQRQLLDAGIGYGSLRALFVTHLHADHVFDYFSAVIAGKPILQQPGFGAPVDVYGPPRVGGVGTPPGVAQVNPANPGGGMTDIHNGVMDAFSYAVNSFYVKNVLGPDIRDLVRVHDIDVSQSGGDWRGPFAPPTDPFPVFQDSRVKVTASLADHPPVWPSFAYRFETADGSVTFGGDGIPCPNVVKLARGSDLLVHEAMHRQAMLERGVLKTSVDILSTTHTDVNLIGRVARDAKVGAVALSHIVPVDGRTGYPPDLPDRAWTKPVARHYDGPVTMGRDLMEFRLGGRRRRGA